MIVRMVIPGLLAAALAASAPHSAQAQAQARSPTQIKTLAEMAVAAEVATRVNVAGRQRMLSQRMTKAACLAAQDVDAGAALDQLSAAYDLFHRSDVALRVGSVDMGLAPERKPEVQTALLRVDEPWTMYRLVVQPVLESGAIDAARIRLLDEAGLDVLREMNAAVHVTAYAHAEDAAEVPLDLAITVDVAGRQRMLTQRAVKEACLMRIAVDPEEQAARLGETLKLFDASLAALRFGFPDAGVIAPPSEAISDKLMQVAILWEPVRAALARAAEGETLSDEALSALARGSEPLLATMNEAVGMYGS